MNHQETIEKHALRYMDENRHADYHEARKYAVEYVNWWHNPSDFVEE
jgi:hypothetical protein